jgi:hypothetical protein
VQEDKMKAVLVTFAVLVGTYGITQTATAQPDGSAQKLSAVNLLRLINTAEKNYRNQEGKYGDFQQLVSADLLKPEFSRFPSELRQKQFNAANAEEPVPGLRLNLSLTMEGNGYHTAVVAAGHGWGFYSDQDAVIFEMHPIG